mgnify:FL=1|jgi:hypothetical protein
MNSSRNSDLILSVFSDTRSVFSLNDIAMLIGESDFKKLNERLNYYVRRGKLLRPRKGVYVKPNYNPEELVCTLYTPSYISLEYVLQKAGVVFQYDERITAVSYLSRSVDIEGRAYAYRKIKGEILVVTQGINQIGNVNIATPERAFLDLLYLNATYHFNNLNPLDKNLITKLLSIYNSKTLTARVKKLLANA